MSSLHPHSEAPPVDLGERIVRASVELIEEQGLSALSMREVARRAGVSHQAPYHRFADREAILGAIAQEGFQILASRLSKVTTADSGPPHARIAAAGQAYVEFACEHPAHFRVMFRPELVNLDRCPGAQAEGDKAFGILQQIVADAIASGLPPKPSAEALVMTCWSVAHGLACLALDGPLARKMPTEERPEQIKAITAAFAHLVASSMPSTDERPAAKSKVPSAARAKVPVRGKKPRKA